MRIEYYFEGIASSPTPERASSLGAGAPPSAAAGIASSPSSR